MSLSKNETDIKQEQRLREDTHTFFGLEKPLKSGPAIATLQELIGALYKEFESDYVNIEMVNHIMLAYQSNPKDWQKFAKFDRCTYTRNLVDEGNGKFNLLIVAWGEGHCSTIHDHADSHCFMKSLQGTLKEVRYEFPDASAEQSNAGTSNEQQQELREIGELPIVLNDVAYINDNLGLHSVGNASHTDTAVSLHLYCPPFDTCSIFQKNSSKSTRAKVTFWSKYGERTKLEH